MDTQGHKLRKSDAIDGKALPILCKKWRLYSGEILHYVGGGYVFCNCRFFRNLFTIYYGR